MNTENMTHEQAIAYIKELEYYIEQHWKAKGWKQEI